MQSNFFPFFLPPEKQVFAADVTGEGWMGVGELSGFWSPFTPVPQKCQSVGSPKLIQQDLQDQFWGRGCNHYLYNFFINFFKREVSWWKNIFIE